MTGDQDIRESDSQHTASCLPQMAVVVVVVAAYWTVVRRRTGSAYESALGGQTCGRA